MKTVVLTIFVALVAGSGEAKAHFLPHKKGLTTEQKVSYFERSITHDKDTIQSIRGNLKHRKLQWFNTNYLYAKRLHKSLRFHKVALVWNQRLLREYQSKLVYTLSPVSAICLVFGPYCSQAVSVAGCETGGTYSVYAQNGQYLGLFQMGSSERAEYGHSYTAYGQAKAAHAYFVDTGSDWSPWECKP